MGETIPYKVGDTVYNNEGDKAILVDFISGTKYIKRVAKVLFEDGTITEVKTPKLKCGSFKNPMKPNVYGVGFIGQGKYLSSHKGEKSIGYTKWNSMIKRCYDETDVGFSHYGGRGVTVCNDWHNYQNFADWFYTHSIHQRRMTLDKDLKCKGKGLIYSKDNCCMIPDKINGKLSTLDSGSIYKRNYYECAYNGSTLVCTNEAKIAEDFSISVKIQKLYEIRHSIYKSSYTRHLVKYVDKIIKDVYMEQNKIRLEIIND